MCIERKIYFMKKSIAIFSLITILLFSFAACGESEAVENTVADIASSVSSACAIQEQLEVTEETLNYAMGITLENVAEFAGYESGVNGVSGTVVVIRATEGKIEDVVTELETYKAANVSFLSNYPEFETSITQAENGVVTQKADVAVLAIAAPDIDYADVSAAIESALQ